MQTDTTSSAVPQKVVLVVEDELFVRLMAVDMLESAGYIVREAGTADEALSLLESGERPVDVMFTDVKMPGSMDGLKLASRVRDLWPDISIIVTSGHVMLPDLDDRTRAAFLPKPYRASALLEQVASIRP